MAQHGQPHPANEDYTFTGMSGGEMFYRGVGDWEDVPERSIPGFAEYVLTRAALAVAEEALEESEEE